MTDQWISVEYSLPGRNIPVLVHRARKQCLREMFPLRGLHVAHLAEHMDWDTDTEELYWCLLDGTRISVESGKPPWQVTHWMHLPTPPEMDEERVK